MIFTFARSMFGVATGSNQLIIWVFLFQIQPNYISRCVSDSQLRGCISDEMTSSTIDVGYDLRFFSFLSLKIVVVYKISFSSDS